jgi:hypothetical protein
MGSLMSNVVMRFGRNFFRLKIATLNYISRVFPLFFLLFLFSNAFSGALMVSWDANSETDLSGYRLYYGTEQANYSESVDVGNVNSYAVQNLTEGQTYYFVLTAYDQAGNESAPSDEVSALISGPQTMATTDPSGVSVQWSPITGADSYHIYRSRDPYATVDTLVATVTDNSFLDDEHPKTKGYSCFYKVKAVSGGSEVYTFNRLGVYNVPLTRGRNLVSIPLVPADSSISEVLGAQLTGGTSSIQSDLAMIWNGTEYEAAWLVEGTTSDYEGKWVTQAGDRLSPLEITPNMAFWLIIRNTHHDSVFTVTGAVASSPERTIDLQKGQNYVGCPYPKAMSLNASELASDGVVAGSTFSAGSDQIRHWNGTGWEVAWLVSGTGTEWDGKWMNSAGTGLSTLQLEPGQGYLLMIKHDNPTNEWTIPNPDPNL